MKHFIILIYFACCQQCLAQLPDYYVYLITGDAAIVKPGAKPIAAKQSQLVFKNDVIVLKKGAEITLVDKEASFLLLNAAGTYKASELIKKATRKTNDGITGKYLKLLFHELLDPNQDFEKFKKENIAGVWGGVSRGDDCGNRIFPINGLKTSAVSLRFKWHKTSPSSNYSFFIYDGEGKELAKMNVKDTMQFVNINETLYGKAGKYFWRVISEDGTCEDEVPIYFDILTPENEKKQADRVAVVTGNESVEVQLQQIDKLEKNAFINAASVSYAAAVKVNPDNKVLLKSYIAFLLKYGFDDEARAAWKP
jgi:hypothetical protein